MQCDIKVAPSLVLRKKSGAMHLESTETGIGNNTFNRTLMKKYVLMAIAGFLLLYTQDGFSEGVKTNLPAEQPAVPALRIECQGELSALIEQLVYAYHQQHPASGFLIDTVWSNQPATGIRIFTLPAADFTGNDVRGKVAIAHDIVVPVMHVDNPLSKELDERGFTDADIKGLLSGNLMLTRFANEKSGIPEVVFISGSPHMVSLLAAYTGLELQEINAMRLSDKERFLSVLTDNTDAIGFCRLADVLSADGTAFADNLKIIPVDKNRNGRIDRFERVHSSPGELVRGVWLGKYPAKLSSKVYAAPLSGTFDEAAAAFMTWVMTEGQEEVASLGYSSLLTREAEAGMLMLNPLPLSDTPASVRGIPGFGVILLSLVAFFLGLILTANALKRKKARLRSGDITLPEALNAASINAPAGLFYDKTHTWAFMEHDGVVCIGINDFLQHVTGNLSQVKMKAPGERIRKGEKMMTIIHEGKQLQVGSPVTGIIKRANQHLADTPSQVNAGPYSTGWVYQVEPSNWLRETKFMFMAAGFKEWLEDEFIRLKDFLAASANTDDTLYNHLVLQDGGELTDHVLANMDPKVWEDFQTHFLDASK